MTIVGGMIVDDFISYLFFNFPLYVNSLYFPPLFRNLNYFDVFCLVSHL